MRRESVWFHSKTSAHLSSLALPATKTPNWETCKNNSTIELHLPKVTQGEKQNFSCLSLLMFIHNNYFVESKSIGTWQPPFVLFCPVCTIRQSREGLLWLHVQHQPFFFAFLQTRVFEVDGPVIQGFVKCRCCCMYYFVAT